MMKFNITFFAALFAALNVFAGECAQFDFDWKFKYFGDKNPGVPTSDEGFRDVQLPHDWAVESPFLANRPNETGKLPWDGTGWYLKTLEVPSTFNAAKERWFLDFDGVMSDAHVYVNGELAGVWPYGYNSFRVDITKSLKKGANTIQVSATNRPRSTRWYPGAGIYRHVYLVKAPLVHLAYNGVFVTTPKISKDKALVKVETTIDNDGNEEAIRVVATEVAGEMKRDVVKIAPKSSATITQELTLVNPELWSVDSPSLYALKTAVINSRDQVLDKKLTRFGVRKIEWKPDGFYLNGERVQIKGVCEHHDLGALGAAFYYQGYERKIKKLKAMGCNSIRMTHNPPAPEVLDLCDKHGILVIDELFDIWKMQKVDKVNGYHRYWPNWWQKDVRNFVMRDRNHPSIIAWSGGNEVPENYAKGGNEVSEGLRQEFKKYDTTRPYTVGTNNPVGMKNGFSETQDVFGFNYKPHLYAEFHAKYPNQPMYGSETCSAISSRDTYFFPYDWHQYKGNKNFQVSSYGQCAVPWGYVADFEWLKHKENPFVAGEYVWTGFDYLGEPTPYNLDASNINNFGDLSEADKQRMMEQLKATAGKAPSRSSYFGLLDLAGFPKDNFYLYQSYWGDQAKPMAHLLPHWNWPGREGLTTPVVCYTNGDEAELFVNGKSYGTIHRGDKSFGNFKTLQKGYPCGKNDYRFIWENVKYEPGLVEVKVKKNGKYWTSAYKETTGKATNIDINVDKKELNSKGHDIAFIELELVDAKARKVVTESPEVKFSVTGPATLIGFCNGDATDWTSLQDPHQKFFNGKILAVVRGNRGEKGLASVVVEAQGLPKKIITFEVK